MLNARKCTFKIIQNHSSWLKRHPKPALLLTSSDLHLSLGSTMFHHVPPPPDINNSADTCSFDRAISDVAPFFPRLRFLAVSLITCKVRWSLDFQVRWRRLGQSTPSWDLGIIMSYLLVYICIIYIYDYMYIYIITYNHIIYNI